MRDEAGAGAGQRAGRGVEQPRVAQQEEGGGHVAAGQQRQVSAHTRPHTNTAVWVSAIMVSVTLSFTLFKAKIFLPVVFFTLLYKHYSTIDDYHISLLLCQRLI